MMLKTGPMTLSTLAVVAMGCVTDPQNNEDIGNYDNNITFAGYIWGSGDKACVYVNDAATGTFTYVTGDTAATSSTNGYGVKGYRFSVADDIPAAYWACNLPLDGTAQSFVKIQETDNGGCLGNFSASQDTLTYTYEAGDNLYACYNSNSSWSGFWNDCPVSDDAPVIRVTADRTTRYPTGCGAQCDDVGDCTDPDVCETASSCNSNNICVYSPASAGTSCNGGDGECNGTDGDTCYCEDTEDDYSEPPGGCVTGQIWCQEDEVGKWACVTDLWNDGTCPFCARKTCSTGTPYNLTWPQNGETECEEYDPSLKHVGENPGVLCSFGSALDCEPINAQ